MKIVSPDKANAVFVEHEDAIGHDMFALLETINAAINEANVDNKSTWTLCGYTTNRVVYVSTDEYLERAVTPVVAALESEGYICNRICIHDGEDANNLLAILWDPTIKGVLDEVQFIKPDDVYMDTILTSNFRDGDDSDSGEEDAGSGEGDDVPAPLAVSGEGDDAAVPPFVAFDVPGTFPS